MHIRKMIGCLAMVLFLLTTPGEAGIFISEFLADPAVDASGDANSDGVVSASGDEFIELFNAGLTEVDLSGWSIADSLRMRHLFAAGTILPAESFLVVFGASQSLSKPDNWQWASTGTLSLNNSGDEIFLYDNQAQVVDYVLYGGEANDNQSLARAPEGTKGTFILHARLSLANGRLFSPGYFVSPPVPQTQVVPEPLTALTFVLGVAALFPRARAQKESALFSR